MCSSRGLASSTRSAAYRPRGSRGRPPCSKTCGHRRFGRVAGYPEDCIQYLVDPWWTVDASPGLCAGRLVRAYIPHIEPEALVLHVDGQIGSTGHASVDIRVGALDAKSPPSPA